MYNFFRAISCTFQYRLAIFGVLLSAFLVGILWGGNIGAVVYPITEICLKQGTFTTWIDQNIIKTEESCRIIKEQLRQQEAASNSTSSNTIPEENSIFLKELQIKELSTEIVKLESYLAWMHWARPYLTQWTPATPFRTVIFLMAIILVGTILKIVFLVLHSYLSAWIAQTTAMEIREDFFHAILNYEVNYFNREGISDTMSRFTNDMSALTGGINIVYGKIVREPIKMIVCLALAAWINWQLLLLTLIVVPIAALCIRWLARSIKRVVRYSLEEMANLYARLEEAFRSIRVVKAFTQESFEQERFHKTNQLFRDKAIKIAKYESLANPVTELFGIVMICVAVVAGAYLMMSPSTHPTFSAPVSVGMLVVFFALLAGAADPARKLSDIFTQFQSAAAASDRIYALIDRPVPIFDPKEPRILPKFGGTLQFEHVGFSYHADRPILHDINLSIPFGECVAIVGPSGCGKSTLLNLIPRFTDPTKGRVLFHNIPLVELAMRDIRKEIGIVTQDPILFNDSVLNNILYGCPTASRAEAIEASKKAFAHDFIENELPNGYDTQIGPAGGQLSGGQRQRISLARAILRNPNIFLLDEATSQIDVQSERMIHDALTKFKQGRTTIMITHRLSALELADRIVVMEEGNITAVGTHQNLLEISEYYRKSF
ncbi:MAG: ABC transporter ATP-binding protein [Thermoguttaceae bacterium]